MRLPSGITVPGFSPNRGKRDLREVLSPFTLHIAAAAILLLLCVYFGYRLIAVSGSTGSRGDDAIAAAQTRVTAAELAAKPLRGVDTKLSASDAEAAQFYRDRLPYAYSDVAAQLGAIAKRTGVRLSRASYVQAAPENGVTELRIDASVSGEYRALAEFINGLERSHVFFLIENLSLSGAQNGLVNVQMRLGTYLREPMAVSASAQAGNGGQP